MEVLAATVAPPAQASAPAAPVEAGPRAVDPEKRAKAAKRQAVKRLLSKADTAQDEDQLWAKLGELASERGKTLAAPRPGSTAAPALDPAKVAKWDKAAREAWEGVALLLSALGQTSPTWAAFAGAMAVRQRELIDAEGATTSSSYDPIQTLAGPTAECLAKWLPESAAGPEARLGGALAAVFVPVGAALAIQALMGRLGEAAPPAPKPTQLAAVPAQVSA